MLPGGAWFQGTNAGGPEPCRGSNHCSYRARCPVLGWGAEFASLFWDGNPWDETMRVEKRGGGWLKHVVFCVFCLEDEWVWSLKLFFLDNKYAFVVCRLFFGIITFDNSPRLFGYVLFFYPCPSYLFIFIALSIIATHTLGCFVPARLLFLGCFHFYIPISCIYIYV